MASGRRAIYISSVLVVLLAVSIVTDRQSSTFTLRAHKKPLVHRSPFYVGKSPKILDKKGLPLVKRESSETENNQEEILEERTERSYESEKSFEETSEIIERMERLKRGRILLWRRIIIEILLAGVLISFIFVDY